MIGSFLTKLQTKNFTMESVMPNPMAQAAYYFYTPEQTVDARRHGSFIPQQPQVPSQQQFYYMLPATPTYSRPSSSSSQPQMPQPQQVLMSHPQPLKPYMHGPIGYPMVGSNARRSIVGANGKPTIMLETDFVDMDVLRLPSTPPLSSTASSTIGSPSACDMLVTPLNPMFSGLDSFEAVKDASIVDVAADQYSTAWSNCASPPFAPGKFLTYFLFVIFSFSFCFLFRELRHGDEKGMCLIVHSITTL